MSRFYAATNLLLKATFIDMKRYPIFILVLVIGLVPTAFSQTTYTISETSSIVIDGESNKSSFSVTAESFEGTVTMTEDAPSAAQLSVDTMQMKSGRSLIMDRLMFGALKSKEHPNITIEMIGAESAGDGIWNISGHLSLAGQTNDVVIEMTQAEVDEALTFSGDYELNMRDYSIKPPTAMFGALITKPNVILHFNLVLSN